MLLSPPGGRNGNSRWILKGTNNPTLKKPAYSLQNQCVGLLTAVHFITGVLTVDHLVTTAEVGDTTAVFALELSWFAQGH